MKSCSYLELNFALIYTRKNIKFTAEQAMKAQWESKAQLYSSFNLGARLGVNGQRHLPAALPPGKRSGTHCTGGWGGARGRSLPVKKIFPESHTNNLNL